MQDLPSYIAQVFLITTLVAVLLFYLASHRSRTTLVLIIIWILVQSTLGFFGFYVHAASNPPRILLLVLPPILLIVGLFNTAPGKKYIDQFDTGILTLLHVVRIPVEIVLFWLSVHKAVPELMTFTGRNFDVFSGLTAPLIFYFGYFEKKLRSPLILIWNCICVGLLLNIVCYAVLSAPLPIQAFAFDQPNVAVLHFPFNLLPACMVPLVLFSHLVCIRQIIYPPKLIVKGSVIS